MVFLSGTYYSILRIRPNVAKVEDATDLRRQGWATTELSRRQAVVNYREPLTTKEMRYLRFSKSGRKQDKLNGLTWILHLVISRNSLELRQDPRYYCFPEPLVMFSMQR
jgi:hypothetical protein